MSAPILTPQQWHQAWDLLDRVCGLAPGERPDALRRLTSDEVVARRVLEMLSEMTDAQQSSIDAAQGSGRAGTTFGKYQIGEELGRGGMGIVYAAVDTSLDRPVAVKFLATDLVAEQVERFINEARSASALNHPNIVTIHEFIKEPGALAIVMERVEGKILRNAFGPYALISEFLAYAPQIARALAAAHARGIVHRDVKPDNIMVRNDGLVKLLDFGIARLMARPGEALTHGLAAGTTAAGTLRYMSPEQIAGRVVTPASDVYSLGIVFYEMLTGKHPFVEQTETRRIEELSPSRIPDIRRLRRGISRNVARLVHSMVDVDAHVRPSAEEVENILGCIKAKPPLRRALPWLAAAVLGVAIVSLLRVREPDLKARLAAARVTPVTRFAGFEFEPNLSPDGQQVAFAWDGDQGNADIYVRSLDSTKPLRLTNNPAHDLSPVWSPDGRSIAFIRASPDKREVFIVPAMGGSERWLCESRAYHPLWLKDASVMRNYSGPAWSPDGQYLALTDRSSSDERDSIYFVSIQSGEKRRITSPGTSDVGDYSPAFSPDGRMLAYARAFSERGLAEIYTQAVGNSSARRLHTGNGAIRGLTWMGANRIVFASTSELGLLWSISSRGGRPEPLTTIGKNLAQPNASVNGRSLVYVEQFSSANVWRMPIRPGGTAARLITSSTSNDSAQYSPDGNKIAFVSDRSGLAEIWIANADGSSPVRLTSSSGLPVGTPRWAPNGHRIVYDSVKNRVSVIYTIDSTGGTARLLGDGRRDSMMPSWSRDGQFIYFVSKGTGDLMQVWKMPVEGGPPVQITTQGGGESVEAPDGKTLYYLKGERGVWQVPVSGGMESLVPGLEKTGTSRYFAVTKRGMYFLAAENRPFNIYFYEFATRQMSLVGTIERTPRFRTPSLSVSPDERWLIYAQEDQSGSDLTLLENVK